MAVIARGDGSPRLNGRLNGGRSGGRQVGRGTVAAMSTLTPPMTLGRQMLNKVPEVTLFFWVIKIMCTTVGETAADYLNVNLGFGLTETTIVTGALLARDAARAVPPATATSPPSTGPSWSSSASSAR